MNQNVSFNRLKSRDAFNSLTLCIGCYFFLSKLLKSKQSLSNSVFVSFKFNHTLFRLAYPKNQTIVLDLQLKLGPEVLDKSLTWELGPKVWNLGPDTLKAVTETRDSGPLLDIGSKSQEPEVEPRTQGSYQRLLFPENTKTIISINLEQSLFYYLAACCFLWKNLLFSYNKFEKTIILNCFMDSS